MTSTFPKSFNRHRLITLAFSLVLASFLPFAVQAMELVSKTKAGVAIKGYDTTAYFQSGKAAKGEKSNIVQWNGATWRFGTAEEAALFEADPTAYTPQFGGYCARAMSLKRVVPAWVVFKTRTYIRVKRCFFMVLWGLV